MSNSQRWLLAPASKRCLRGGNNFRGSAHLVVVMRNFSAIEPSGKKLTPPLQFGISQLPAALAGTFLVKPLTAATATGHSSQHRGRARNVQKRHFSSARRSGSSGGFKLDALAFSISPERALAKFEKWARDEQGLRYLLSWSSVRIAASYVPVWSFDVNLRFKAPPGSSSSSTAEWKPAMFEQAYPNQSTIYVSGLSAYSGHSYRRSLVNPIHNTTLVFLGDQTQPFGDWMLRGMKLSNGEILEVFPDPWNATKGRALDVVRQDLTTIAQAEHENATVKTQVVSARRVYMPTFVVEYSILGIEYQAFLSGCDDGAGVSGADHQLWRGNAAANLPSSHSFLSGVSSAASFGTRILGTRGIATVLAVAFQFLSSVAARLLIRLPPVALLASIYVGFRKVIYPWVDHRYASAEWERQREREASADNYTPPGDDFDDLRGNAKRYYEKNKARILRELSGENEHQKGDYDWYKEWEEWARRQYEQQAGQQGYTYQQQQQQTHGRQQQQQQQTYGRQQKPKTTTEYKWDFDPNDPYSVLGIRRGASKSEVSAAFRREMLKYHPDVQIGASEAAKERAQERSKYITDAYRKIKSQMK